MTELLVDGDPVAAPTPTRTAKTGTRPIWIILGFLIVATVGVTMLVVRGSASRTPHVFEYRIAPGTSARIEAGEQLFVFPARLDVRVGDQLVIHNDDARVIQVGPYTVDRNATLAQSFNAKGTIVGICTIHPSGKVTIEVHG